MFFSKKISPEQAAAMVEAERLKNKPIQTQQTPANNQQQAVIEPPVQQNTQQAQPTEPIKQKHVIKNAGAKHIVTRSLLRRSLNGMRIAPEVFDKLEEDIMLKIQAARRRAEANRRVTVMVKDL